MTRTLTRIPLAVVEEDSPVGKLSIALRDGTLVALTIEGDERWFDQVVGHQPTTARHVDELQPADRATVDTLRRYFNGDVLALDTLDVDATGSPFQHGVWRATARDPGGLDDFVHRARPTGRKSLRVSRVGRANATNPIAIVVPCHRVVRADGALGGYASGIERKRWLLDHEERHAAPSGATAPAPARYASPRGDNR